jgi:hypothetical protein
MLELLRLGNYEHGYRHGKEPKEESGDRLLLGHDRDKGQRQTKQNSKSDSVNLETRPQALHECHVASAYSVKARSQ